LLSEDDELLELELELLEPLESLSEELELLELLEEEELLLSESLSLSAGFCAMIIFGKFFRCSRSSSVKPPRPMEVKKLMANLVFLGVSLGIIPWKYSAMPASCSRWFSFLRPSASESSWKRILMKMRDDDVVASSVSWRYARHVHETASVERRCAKNLAVFLSLFVSRRWIVEYCFRNTSSNSCAYF
jgi:hypothetical protein